MTSEKVLFVLRFYGPVKPMGSCRARCLPNHTFTGHALSSKRLTSIAHILSPETDNCPSWISGRERMTVKNISWSISTKECCRPWRGLNPRPPGLQSDAHPTEPASEKVSTLKGKKLLPRGTNNSFLRRSLQRSEATVRTVFASLENVLFPLKLKHRRNHKAMFFDESWRPEQSW